MPVLTAHSAAPNENFYASIDELGSAYEHLQREPERAPPENVYGPTYACLQREPERAQPENVYGPASAAPNRNDWVLALSRGRPAGIPQRPAPSGNYEQIPDYEEVQNPVSPSAQKPPSGQYFELESHLYEEVPASAAPVPRAPSPHASRPLPSPPTSPPPKRAQTAQAATDALPQDDANPSKLMRKGALSLGKKGVGKGASAEAAVAAVAAARAATKRPPPADDSKPTPPPRSRSQSPTHMAPNPQQNALTDALTEELKAQFKKLRLA